MKKIILISIPVMLIFLLAACDAMPDSSPQLTPAPVTDTLLRDNTVSASGEVVPEKWASLGMSAAGIVEEVLVNDGDLVKAGQVLVRLHGKEDALAKIAAAEYALIDAKRALDTLKINATTQAAQAQKAAADAQKAVEDAQKKVNSLTYGRASDTTLENLESKIDLAKQQLAVTSDLYRQVQDRSDGDSTKAQAKLEMTNAQINLNNLMAEYNWLTGKATETEAAQYYANLALAESQLEEANRLYNIFSKGPDPAELKVANALVKNAEAQLAAAKTALGALELVSPFNGMVSDPHVRTGEYINYGQPVLQIADYTTLRVQTIDLNETDVARVQEGDPVIVTFDALPDVEVKGTVLRIASKASEGSGVNYAVTIGLDSIPDGLRWGMTAFVVITVQD